MCVCSKTHYCCSRAARNEIMTYEELIKEGRQAAFNGKEYEECPYTCYPANMYWSIGWRQGTALLEQGERSAGE